MDLKGKKVLVIGLGRSGIAASRYLVSEGASVIAADAKAACDLPDVLCALKGMQIDFLFGCRNFTVADKCDLIVASPGVPLNLPGLPEARAKGIPIVGELDLAVRRIARPIIAVTGTNGKTTTASLIGHLLNEAGISACVAGNIGTPLIDVMDEAQRSQFVVVEVSSFQMDTTPSLAANIAIWLNATFDHIDRHGTFENYLSSKSKLFTQIPDHGTGIYNAADECVSRSIKASRCRLIPFDATGKAVELGYEHRTSSAGSAWYSAGDLCIRIDAGEIRRYPISGTNLSGLHNFENMLAALSAAELAGASYEALCKGLSTFKGLPHRMQFISEHKGVSFYDDSKGTNIGATIRALDSFSKPVILIAGGQSKGVDFSPLAPKVKEKVKKLILIGEAADEMERMLGVGTNTAKAGSMDEAVQTACSSAKTGDVVLLSPACASFDMFKDYADRGNAFAKAVMRFAAPRKGA